MRASKAVLFDLDGTLIDSMALFQQSVADAVARHGGSLKPEYFMKWHAGRLPWADLLTEYSIDLSHETDVQRYSKEHFQELLRTQIAWMPGAEGLLRHVRVAGIPSGIVTTAFKSFVDAVNEKLTIHDLVDLLITAEDVGEKGKPNPYGLLLAAQKLGIDPKEAIYIGDQPFDVLAANAAGMESWLVQHPHTPADAGKHAKLVLPNLTEALRILNPAS
jgi:phosphoglycolate phosphatase